MTKGYSLTLYGAYRYFRESLLKIYNKDLYDFIFIELLLKNFYNYLDKSLETDLFLRVSSDTLLSYYLTKIEKDIFYTTQVSDGHTKLLYVRFVLKRFDSSIYVKTPLGLSKKRVCGRFFSFLFAWNRTWSCLDAHSTGPLGNCSTACF